MGFEMTRRLPDGSEDSEVIVVQDLLDAARELTAWEQHCSGCPANRAGVPFGCTGYINYPISAQAERWLLDQLPDNDHPLLFVLLQKAIRDMGYTGDAAAPLRGQEGIFLESHTPLERDFGNLCLTGNQVFELLFMSGPVKPAHGALLLQFFGGISPDLDADTMMKLAAPPSPAWVAEHVPFLHAPGQADDSSIDALKKFFRAVYIAFRLGVPLLIDA
jgi:hypothetical protein